ncbi:MAG: nucleoside deaminase [Bacteroidota bacterium]
MGPLYTDEYFMGMALKEAAAAFEDDEVPVGAVIVCNDRIIARGSNQTERLTDVTAHAEIIAITAAANHLGAKFLDECTLYVTLEPCVMCAGAIGWARPMRVVYGASDEKRGFSTVQGRIFHPKTQITSGILAEECGNLVREFFRRKR